MVIKLIHLMSPVVSGLELVSGSLKEVKVMIFHLSQLHHDSILD